ncbi:MAG: SUMF1/EgtB/PvdO family nonheme iron enzyme [Albidovulum sp.]
MKRLRWLGSGVLLLIGLLGGERAAMAERVALVIGNGAYRHAPPLDNPQRDAEAMAKALGNLGFTVVGGPPNRDKAQMDAAMKAFGARARTATAAVVYFSGHGMEAGGRNYLIPVDAELKHENDAALEAVPLEVVLNQVGGARDYGLVILDACRDNPLADRMRLANGQTKGFGGTKGLKPVEPSGQVYVAYAAKGGMQAQEGSGSHSLFTAALLKYLQNYRQEPLPLPSLFGAVREDVLEATTKTQEPWLYGAFGKRLVYLTGEPTDSGAGPGVAVPPPDMVRIAGGRFPMGSPESETGRKSDETPHGVTVKDFEMGRHEVTVGEFRRFADASGYRTDAERNAGGREGCYIAYREGSEWKYGYRAGYSWKNPGFKQGDDHPVACVSWNDAMAYIEWLSKATGQRYGLPTEAEWEYAARAGTASARYWGEDPDQACRYANVYDQSSERVNSFGWEAHACDDGWVQTAPVGSFQANAWGLKDMLGNVWEWTCSLYDKDYGGAEAKCADKGTSAALAVRGGGWSLKPARVRSAYRFWDVPATRNFDLGFRLARSL